MFIVVNIAPCIELEYHIIKIYNIGKRNLENEFNKSWRGQNENFEKFKKIR